jgi:hypothetical protein
MEGGMWGEEAIIVTDNVPSHPTNNNKNLTNEEIRRTLFCNHRASFHSHYLHTPTGCNFI